MPRPPRFTTRYRTHIATAPEKIATTGVPLEMSLLRADYQHVEDDDASTGKSHHRSEDVPYEIGGSHSSSGLVANGRDVEEPPRREIIVTTLTQFMGYAILVAFQAKLKAQLGIVDGNNADSHQFAFAVSFLYIGNLVFRLLHNVVFAFITPRTRVFVSMGAMSLAMFFLGVCVFVRESKSIAWVFLAYALGGTAIGSFESNLLSCITPLGHATKVWAIIGFPAGFACVSIVGFMLTAAGVPPVALYLAVMVLVLVGMAVFAWRIPHVPIKHNADSLSAFWDNFVHWREWFPLIVWHCLALTVDMYCVSLFSGILLFIFNGTQVPIFGPASATLFPHDWFFAIHNCFSLVGDSLSRKVMYLIEPRHPWLYLVACLAGAALCLLKVAFVAPLGIFLVFFANGSIYATTTRHIDTNVDKQYNLIALSVWLFIGDIGSVAGSNTLPYVRARVAHSFLSQSISSCVAYFQLLCLLSVF